MMTCLADEDIRKEVLRWGSLDQKDINEIIGFIEAKEMSRNAMTQLAIAVLVSLFSAEKIRSLQSVLLLNNSG